MRLYLHKTAFFIGHSYIRSPRICDSLCEIMGFISSFSQIFSEEIDQENRPRDLFNHNYFNKYTTTILIACLEVPLTHND